MQYVARNSKADHKLAFMSIKQTHHSTSTNKTNAVNEISCKLEHEFNNNTIAKTYSKLHELVLILNSC